MGNSGVLKQFLSVIACNVLAYSYGSTCSWTSPNFSLLTSDDTPLPSGKLTDSEASLVVSIPCFGAMIGTIIYTVCVDRLGRKLSLFSIAISQLVSWTVILLAPNVYYLYAARLLGGIVGAGCFVVIPVFTSEVADDKVRGTLASMLILGTNTGMLLGFILPIYLDYFQQIKANLMIPIVFLLAFNFFPETPEFLLKRNQKTAAEKSQNFYRGITNSPALENKTIDEKDKAYDMIQGESTSLSFSDFCTPAAKKATMIALFLGFLNQFCGVFAMSSYTNKIFEDAGSALSSDTSSVIIATSQVVANALAMILVDRAGRKLLITISAFGTAVGLISMGLYDIYKDNLEDYKWIPILSFAIIIMTASVGMLPLTYVILGEILPKKIKNLVTLMSLEMVWVLAFLLLSTFPLLTQLFGMAGCMFFFAACCLVGVAFYMIVLPETKGKSHDEIMQAMAR